MTESIRDIYEKFKGRALGLRVYLSSGMPFDVFLVLVVILVGLSGFSLGRLSALDEGKSPVRITSKGGRPGIPSILGSGNPVLKAESIAAAAAVPGQGMVVASKNGTKYHLPSCPGAQRITEANKIWFDSIEEAKKAGYTPASNCKGI